MWVYASRNLCRLFDSWNWRAKLSGGVRRRGNCQCHQRHEARSWQLGGTSVGQKTSTPAILMVVLEVSILTAFLGLGMHALGGLQIDNGDVNAPGHPGVRDYMLRYMAEIFVGGQFGPSFGQVAGWIVTGVFGFLLLSAVNCTGFQ